MARQKSTVVGRKINKSKKPSSSSPATSNVANPKRAVDSDDEDGKDPTYTGKGYYASADGHFLHLPPQKASSNVSSVLAQDEEDDDEDGRDQQQDQQFLEVLQQSEHEQDQVMSAQKQILRLKERNLQILQCELEQNRLSDV